MNAAQVIDHFDQICEAPDAIPRLRRFILGLAVYGKLVEQDPNDEPANELLKRILEKKASFETNKTKKRKTETMVNPGENPFELPHGWTNAPLAEVTAVINGRAYSRNELLNSGTPVLRVGNLFTSKQWYYSNLRLEDEKYCDAGDLLFAWSASFGPFIWPGPKAIYHYHIWKLRLHSDSDLDKFYLYNFLRHKTQEIKDSGHGVSMIHMTKEKMEEVVVPVPPLAEQHRIVAKIDELMALCDRLETAQTHRENRRDKLVAASLHRLNNGADGDEFREHSRFHLRHLPRLTTRPEHIQQLRQTILNLAVRGKLVPQDPKEEPAEKWYPTINKEDARNCSYFGEPSFALPKGWLWLQIASVFEVAGGIQKTPHRTPWKNAFPYLGVANVYRGRLDLTNVKTFELEPGELERRKLVPGDLLIIEGNGSFNEIGRCAKWSGEIENCVHQNHVIRCRPCDATISDFVLLFLNSPIGMEIMQRLAITSSGLYSLSVGKIRQIEIPVPPLTEQRRIVAKVDELMALVDVLEGLLATARTTAEKLMEAVVAELTACERPAENSLPLLDVASRNPGRIE